MMSRFYPLLTLALSFLGCFPSVKVAGQFSETEFNDMAEQMAKGSVPEVTPQQLSADCVLLDTRERAEYEISHLAGARWVGFKDFDLGRVKDLPKDTPIVTYCSVGYRSERIGEQLQAADFTNVRNLKGGIFNWVNLGKAVVNSGGQAVETVHGYDEKWAKWVKNGRTTW